MDIKVVVMRQLVANAEAIRYLVENVTDEQAQWKPNPETWSLKDTLEHLYHEERLDFRRHLKELLSEPPQPWGRFLSEQYVPLESCRKALEGFLTERDDSLSWLKSLDTLDWEQSAPCPWGTARLGDVLVSWAAHDYLHLRQINELLYAWNEHKAAPFSVEYAGGW